MKHRKFKHTASHPLVGCMIVTLISLSAATAQAQCSNCGGNFVGDMTVESAGCSGCSSCGDGGCLGGDCSNGNCGGNGSCGGAGCQGGNCLGGGCNGGSGGVISRGYGQPDLFYNYFTQGYANRANAQMYLSPMPIPPNVGHTFYTYQPFYPHHMMYWHKDRYHRYYDNGRGMNRTKALYYSPPVRQYASNLYWNFLRIPR